MCGRFTLASTAEDLARKFELEEAVELGAARFNIAPTQPVASVRADRDGRRALSLQRWGLIPYWAKDPRIGNRMINARAESAADKPAYRDALRRRRCLVAADGFYEWGGKGAARRAHHVTMREGEPFGIAALWERWRDPEGQWIESCVLMTTEANACVRPIHERMPVILDPRDYGRWLDPGERDAARVLPLLVPCPPDWLVATAVGRQVNDPSYDDPSCIAPVQPE